MSDKNVMGKASIRSIVFEELSVMEILTYLDYSFCSAKLQYVKYDRNLREAWDDLSNTPNHYDSFCSLIGLVSDHSKEIKYIGKALFKYMDPDEVTVEQVTKQIKDHFPVAWFKGQELTKEQDNRQFALFQNSLFEYLETKFMANEASWGLKLVRRKETKKGNKHAKR